MLDNTLWDSLRDNGDMKMKRRRSEYSQGPLPNLNRSTLSSTGIQPKSSPPSAMESAHKTINECIDGFYDMQLNLIRVELIGKGQKEVLDKKAEIVCWLEGIFKETGESFVRDLTAASEMVASSSFYFPATRTAFSLISQCIQGLFRMQHDIYEMVSSLSKGESVDEKQHEVLRIKSIVVLLLEMLFLQVEKEEETSDEDVDMESRDPDDFQYQNEVVLFPEQEQQLNEEDWKWSNVNETEGPKEKERYLCLSNGFEIWCLDLKKSLNLPNLPTIDTLSLLGEQLPSSVGMFKLGSNAYMIGGQKFPASVKDTVSGRNPKGLDLYKALCSSMGVKGSSRVTYRLSLTADEEHGTLNLSHTTKDCCFEELNKPKVWPIVERIEGKLHVIDSDPTYLTRGKRDRMFSHEVRGDGGGWREIIPRIEEGEDHVRVTSHIVIGHRIFAVTDGRGEVEIDSDGEEKYLLISGEKEGCRFLVFDSQTEEWKGRTHWEYFRPLSVKRVWDILSLGFGRCAVEFRHHHPDVDVDGGEPLYVVIALMMEHSVVAIAYLVRLTGEVVSYQRLPHFFSDSGLHMQPINIGQGGVMIHVDDEEEGPARTMCSVLTASIPSGGSREYVFVNTFSVEVVNSEAVSSAVGQLLVRKASQEDALMELEFVRFAVKNWYIYNIDRSYYVGWQACFLTPTPTPPPP